VQILAHWDTEAEALDHEVLLISCIKDMGINLANLTDGGEGGTGYKHTEKHKKKMKGNTYGASSWGMTFKGKTHTSEQKAKWAVIRKGVTSPRKGVKLLDSTKEKMRIAKLGKPNLKKRKLTDQEVIEIRQKLKPRNITKLAKEYGVGSTTIARIRDGEAYKEVK
jgi:hypothetical protein